MLVTHTAPFKLDFADNLKAAIDCCVMLNYWEDAVKLAEQHGFSQIEGLLAK